MHSSVIRPVLNAATLSAERCLAGSQGSWTRNQLVPVLVAYRRLPMKIQADLPCSVIVPSPGVPLILAGSPATLDHAPVLAAAR